MIIDAYSHCAETKYLPVGNVLAAMAEAGVGRAVLCQHLENYDNRYLADVVAQNAGRFAAVCLVDPGKPDAVSVLRSWHQTGHFRGIRLLGRWLNAHFPFCLEAVDLGLNLLIYTPDGIQDAVPHLLKVVHERPFARIVISHLGNPKVVGKDVVRGSAVLALASEENIHVQLSGLSMFCEYPHSALDALISDVARQFGPRRLLWGSNFPVCGDIQAYRRDLALVQSGAWGLDPDGVDWVTGRAAERFWFN